MKRYRIKPKMLFLSDERIIIDTDRKLIRKYNETGCRIIELLCHDAITMNELKQSIQYNAVDSVICSKDLKEFMKYLTNTEILDISDTVK
jgi:hypothetical protein